MWRNSMKWMFLILGTMIGAGYASGRELWEFFGRESGLAIIFFAVLFIVCSMIIMQISYSTRSTHYLPVFTRLMGGKLAHIYDYVVIIYLFSMTVVMLAGGGATLTVIRLPYLCGVIFIGVAVAMLFIWETKGITTVNLIIIPILIVCLVIVLCTYLFFSDVQMIFSLLEQSNWPISFTFTALNILPLIAVLSAVGAEIKSKGEIYIASIGSGVILGVISYLYNESLIHLSTVSIIDEIPLFAILAHYPYAVLLIMSALLWFAIYTTAAAGVFGLLARIRVFFRQPAWVVAFLIVMSMIPFTTIGFATLVSIIYPFYSILNLYLLASILLYPIYHHRALRER